MINTRRRIRGTTFLTAAVFIVFLIGAASNTLGVVFNDVVVTAESTAAGQRGHGYAEYRATVTNLSTERSHEVELIFPTNSYGGGDYIKRMTRKVTVGPGSSASVAVYQPPLMMRGNGMGVVIDERLQRESVPMNYEHYSNSYGRNGICVLVGRSVNRDDIQKGLETVFPSSGGMRYGSATLTGLPHGMQNVDLRKSEVAVAGWSENWLAYSSYDGVVVSLSEMLSMPAAIRSALLEYTRCGGSVLVIGKWDKPDDWRTEDHLENGLVINHLGFGLCVLSDTSDLNAFGKETWRHLVNIWSRNRSVWKGNTNISSANKQFPVIASMNIPVRGLFLLVLLFAIVIGPVNLYLLSKKKKRMWMLWTVPLVSILASLSVFAYAFLAEGWQGQVRIASVTLLDEATHRATTIGMLGLYSPLTPREGLHFDYETELTPIGMEDWRGGSPRTIDWSEDQHFDKGWVSARVPAIFRVRKSSMARQRVQIGTDGNGGLTAVNGLGSDILQLWYADGNGKIYCAENIEAGAKTVMKSDGKTVKAELNNSKWREILAANWSHNSANIINNPNDYLMRDHYLAVLKEEIFIEQPMENVKTVQCQSIVIGQLSKI